MVNIKTAVPNASQYGAKLGYTTYEAEQSELKNGVVKNASSSEAERATAREASGQAYVDLPTNASVSFIAQADANAVTIRYTVPDGESGKVEVKVNNTVIGTLDLSSKSNWQYLDNYTYHPNDDIKVHDTPAADRLARFQFDEVSQLFKEANIKVGDKVTITNIDSTPVGIDLVDLEKAPDAIRQPENSVSITDFGAVANDGSDDYQAFIAAIESAKASKKSVYIPEGQFDFSRPISLYVPDGIKITGAGQWHTKLHFLNTEAAKYDDKGYASGGGGISFEPGSKDIDLGNLSMDSNLNSRHDEKANYKGISGTLGTGSSIHDIKIEHFEAGVWIGDYSKNKPLNYTDGLTISNATIRNNFADGVNFAQGTSNSTVINSNIRGNGDDGLATWSSHHENTNAHVAENNHFLNNTVELGWRAAGIGIFGGKGHEVANNLIKDNANWGGVRLNTVFKNSHNFDFNDTGISVHDNLLVNNGTNADTYGRVKGSIDLEEGRDYATPEKDILGELNNIKIENNTIVNNLSDQEITKTRNHKEGNIPEPVNETTLTIENNHSLSVAENTSAKNVAEIDDHSLTQAANHLGADNIITITDSSHALVSGGDGNDRIRGGLGNDTINGDSGNDIIFGYDGNDRLNGGMGNDSIHGGNGNDTLWGESGNDRLNGGDGNDVLFGGQGTDYLVGGKGADTYVFSLGEGKDTITDNVGEHNALQFGQNISVNDLHIDAITDVRGNIDWKITVKGSEGDSITINDQFVSGNTNNAVIDTFRFDEGTLSLQELMGRLSGNDNISNLSDVNTHTDRMSYSSVDTVDVHDDTASTANAGII
ncbi:type 1 secretion protein [Neisseria sp. HMSC067G11]|jgi:putative iron-regulated protein frpC|uniref:calcium-binding protein n=1 Tax=Neisseria TaxID=482 RepID=UPI00066E46FB|nr:MULTISPECIES: calcium-binding protein [unclassified Neisseria]OFK05235.1 type 1 secretion protein [Neisseria sp. HMSC067H04]OFL30897.1 type 1 secretion protein [Neisseria sp. HMSC075C12]OFR57861.1 type 1 secretion protein [Neisseria sp. HMSC067G11]OFR71766.1 type 1 secretion protein [Neisseria sp. HMSC067G12]